MARPVEHGARWLAARLEANRLEPRVRRMLGKLQKALANDTWPTVAGLVQARIARRELLMQQREAALLADPAGPITDGKWLLGLWAAQRRDLELLALLERRRESEATPTLASYLDARRAQPEPPVTATEALPRDDAEDGRPDTAPQLACTEPRHAPAREGVPTESDSHDDPDDNLLG